MNRRTFLQTTGAALAASALTPLARAADAAGKKRPLKKAVNLGMVKGGQLTTLEISSRWLRTPGSMASNSIGPMPFLSMNSSRRVTPRV